MTQQDHLFAKNHVDVVIRHHGHRAFFGRVVLRKPSRNTSLNLEIHVDLILVLLEQPVVAQGAIDKLPADVLCICRHIWKGHRFTQIRSAAIVDRSMSDHVFVFLVVK